MTGSDWALLERCQYRPNDELDINIDIAYAQFDTERKRYSIDGVLSASDFRGITAGPPTVDPTGLITKATVDDVVSRSENILTPEEEDLLLVNIDGGYRISDAWEARGKIGYSASTRVRPEFRSVWQTSGEFSFDLTDRIYYAINQTNADFKNPADFIANQSRFETFDIEDEEVSAQGDIERSFGDDSPVSSIQLGVRYSDREKSQIELDDRITVTSSRIAPSPSMIAPFPVDDFLGGNNLPQIERTWFIPDFGAARAEPALVPPGFSPRQVVTNSFAIQESTASGYVQANIDVQSGAIPIRGDVGVRFVNTDQTSNGFAIIDGTPTSVTVDNSYTESLPSLNLVVEAAEDFLIRLAASTSLTRPTLTSLSPGGSIQPTGLTASTGNPLLEPFAADQFDFSLEWYLADESLIALTYFHKDVDGFVTRVTSNATLNNAFPGITGPIVNDDGEDVINEVFAISQPINGDAATVKGFEASFQRPLTFLPAPFDGLGIMANYTRADSESTITFNGVQVTTLLPGQSGSSYNVVAYWENERFSARAAYSWRDDYLREVRPRQTERSNFIRDYGQLDLNLQYNVDDRIVVTFDALNVTDEEEQEYGETTDRNRRTSNWGRFLLLGARIKFD